MALKKFCFGLIGLTALAGLHLVIGAGSGITTASGATCRKAMPDCDNLHGAQRDSCEKARALNEAACQAAGVGPRVKGKGPKYNDCMARAKGFSVDSASPTSWENDC